MRALPRRFKTLDGKWFNQVGKNDVLVKDLAEAGFDRIITDHREVLTELLVDAGLIDADSKLKLLAVQHDQGQVLNIDVLFAEVDGKGEDEEFRRLIVVEDKLEKNAESRRQVLVQIMDYERELQNRSKSVIVWNHLRRHFPEWTAANQEDIQTCLDEGNFLLVLAGDQFDPRLIDLVDHYKSRIDPTDLAEICLVSFAIFRGPDNLMSVIPNLVGAVTRGHRDITISVRVTTPSGEPLRAELNEVVETRDGTKRIRMKRQWDAQSFFAELGKVAGPEAVDVARRVQAWADAEGQPVEWGEGSADGSLKLPFLPLGRAYFLSLDTKGRLWVYPGSIRNVPFYGDESARRDILQRLNRIPGVTIVLDKVNTFGAVPLSALLDDTKFEAFLSVVKEVYGKARQHLEA